MYRKFLIREQAPPPIKIDDLLKRAQKVGCFSGFEELTNGYQGRAALGKWSNDKSKYVYVQSDVNDKDLFLVTEVDPQGTFIQSFQNECEKITGDVFKKEVNRADQARIDLFIKERKYLFPNDPNGNPTTYTWTDINKDTDAIQYLGPELVKVLTGDKPYHMWKPNAFAMDYEDVNDEAKKFVAYLEGKKWVKKPDLDKISEYVKCDLQNTSNQPTKFGENCYKGSLSYLSDRAGYFKQGYTLYMPKGTAAEGESDKFQISNYKVECNTAMDGNYQKNQCQTCIDSYYRAAKAGRGKSPEPGYPEVVDMCLAKNYDNFPKYAQVIDYLRGRGLSSDQLAWKITNVSNKQKKDIFGNIKVREERLLKQTILESLQSLKEQKRKMMIESVILENRLKVLSEKKNLRNKKNLDSFLNNFLTETVHYHSQGFNQKVLSEQWTNWLESFLAGPGLGGVFGYVKEYAVKWLLNKLGVSGNSWIADIISTTIGNIPIGDIPKITDCNFVTPLLSKSIAETIAKKFVTSSKKGEENQIMGVVRNTVFEVLDDIPFVQALEAGVSKAICPMWGDLTSKLGKVSNKLSGASEAASPSEPKGMDSILNSAKNLIGSTGNIMNNVNS